VIPGDVVDEVLAEAERLTETEIAIRQALREGMSLAECLQKYGHV
jgi:regulator of RNase E activity RraA